MSVSRIPFLKYSASNNGVTLTSGLGGCSRSLKMAPFDRYTTYCWYAIVSSSYLTLNNIMTLKSGLMVTQGH